jgi:hypothetical protein
MLEEGGTRGREGGEEGKREGERGLTRKFTSQDSEKGAISISSQSPVLPIEHCLSCTVQATSLEKVRGEEVGGKEVGSEKWKK